MNSLLPMEASSLSWILRDRRNIDQKWKKKRDLLDKMWEKKGAPQTVHTLLQLPNDKQLYCHKYRILHFTRVKLRYSMPWVLLILLYNVYFFEWKWELPLNSKDCSLQNSLIWTWHHLKAKTLYLLLIHKLSFSMQILRGKQNWVQNIITAFHK